MEKFKPIFPSTLQNYSDDELVKLADIFALQYSNDLSDLFSKKLLIFRNAFQTHLQDNNVPFNEKSDNRL